MTEAQLDQSCYVETVRAFFDEQYRQHERYWWKGDNRYCLDPARHTSFHAKVLQVAIEELPGRALDVGAGEGADAIRLAKLGYDVDAIELSPVACEKMEAFARDESVRINIRNESVLSAELERRAYAVVIMNGSLHYVSEKTELLQRIRQASSPAAVHIMSLFSTATPVPAAHATTPVFPDDEHGVVEETYLSDRLLYATYLRGKAENSHPGFGPHEHSFINQIIRLARGRNND